MTEYEEYIDGIPVHPYAATYPMMSDRELQELAEDIKAHGLREPIVLAHVNGIQDGEIVLIDGRNRFKACEIAGVEPAFRTDFLLSGADIEPWIESKNAHRRHLTPEQKRAAIERSLRSNPELPDYRIAKETGTSPHTVKRVRQSNPDLQGANERVNSRGQKRPATYNREPVEIDMALEQRAREKAGITERKPATENAAERNVKRFDALTVSRKILKDMDRVAELLRYVGGVRGMDDNIESMREALDMIAEANNGRGMDAEIEKLLGGDRDQ